MISKINFSGEFNELLNLCPNIARQLHATTIRPEHLILAMLFATDSVAYSVLNSVAASPLMNLREQLMELLSGSVSPAESEKITVSDITNRIIRLSALEANALHSNEVGTEHLLLAIFHSAELRDSDYINIFKEADVTYARLRNNISELVASQDDIGSDEGNLSEAISPRASFSSGEVDDPKASQPSSRQSRGRKTSDTPALDKFGFDMTAAAERGDLDPVVSRDVEIERLAQILSRRKKNNPVLIGEPGVGKSAIVEGLALRIIQRKVSRVLFDKRVISLDMVAIVAGTKYRGEFEERIKNILNELSKNKDIILFIDEIHTIVGAGNSTGTMDAANLLKPALARGEVQCIGATTLDEYRKNIEKDGALERRFQKVMVEPTSIEETITILKNVKDKYEQHHNVNYTDDAIEACVYLTERYMSDRTFPDKALDALDEAGSRVHVTNVSVPKEIEDIESEITATSALKSESAINQDFEKAASYRDKEQELRARLAKAKHEWEISQAQHRQTVDQEKVAEVVAMMTGIPVTKIAKAESKKLKEMIPQLQSAVIGQDAAIEKIVKAIQRNRLGLKDPNKPIGTFMFLGPTGVGKTYLAKKLAENLFDSPDALIRIDMSEYMEKFTVSRLVGAPPGYVGYEEGGQLTEKVRRHPYSVVLLDEIEKAHPDVFNLLLQVMDEGRLTDSLGRKIDFKNTIIILTSNVGTRQLKEFGSGVGFTTPATDKDFAQGVLKKALNKAFAPEFLNRIDDIVMFDQLDRNAIFLIIELELKDFFSRIEMLGYSISLSDAAKNFIADKGYDIQYGARPLKRAIQKYLEDELASLILESAISQGDSIKVDYIQGNDKLSLSVVTAE